MRTRRALVPSVALLAAVQLSPLALAKPCPDEVVVIWKGVETKLGDLPAEIAARLQPTLEHWLPWAGLAEYRTLLEDEARVVLLTRARERLAQKQLELVQKSVAAFEALLPAPPRDPEETFLEAEWGQGEIIPDRDPVVLVELDRTEHFVSLLDYVGQTSPQLASWAQGMKSSTGFVHEGVLSAAWLSAPPDLELGDVWRPGNELVHRLARVLLRRRFGDQPHWFKVGVAWRLEQDVLGDIYSFPGRNTFVGVGEHVGWEGELKRAFGKRKKEPLRIAEFGEWRTGTWDDSSAACAWGMVTFLARHRPESLSSIAEGFRKAHKRGAIVVHEDETWELLPGYQVPLDEQLAILKEHAGEDVLEQASEAFRQGRKYKGDR